MDNRPIGICDSGLGGLTCYRELSRLLPDENTAFFGDTARLPYGGRDRETLRRFTLENIALLRARGVKAVLIACGSMSSAYGDLPDLVDGLPVLRLTLPTAAAAVAATRNRKIAVIATAATIASGAFQTELKRLCPGCVVTAAACPKLVPAIEDGHTAPDDPLISALLAEYLAPIATAGADTLVLGCTHYPLIADAVAAGLPGVTLVDSGAALAHAGAALLERCGLRCQPMQSAEHHFYVSGDPTQFAQSAVRLLGEDISARVQRAATAAANPAAEGKSS